MCDHDFQFVNSITAIQKINEFSIPFVKACENFTIIAANPYSPGGMN